MDRRLHQSQSVQSAKRLLINKSQVVYFSSVFDSISAVLINCFFYWQHLEFCQSRFISVQSHQTSDVRRQTLIYFLATGCDQYARTFFVSRSYFDTADRSTGNNRRLSGSYWRFVISLLPYTTRVGGDVRKNKKGEAQTENWTQDLQFTRLVLYL